jgi:hypothetical protein
VTLLVHPDPARWQGDNLVYIIFFPAKKEKIKWD